MYKHIARSRIEIEAIHRRRGAVQDSAGAGTPEALTANSVSTPAVVATGPGFAPNTGALRVASVVTLATDVFGLVPPPLTARARK
jgi:hypothetical protein